jgi:antitoxin (DNA-binding transcriptional repressor) of toxin-antitoxin stability system
MQTITLDDAQRRLTDLVHQLDTHGEVVIVEGNRPVARLSAFEARPSLRKLKPTSVGAVLHPFPSPDDDLLGEMSDAIR